MRHTSRLLMLLLLVGSAWYFGGVTRLGLAIWYSLIATACLLGVLSHPHKKPTRHWLNALPWLLLAALIAAQALNPSHVFDPDRNALKSLTYREAFPASVDAAHSWASLMRLAAFGLLLWTTRLVFSERRFIRPVLLLLACHGFIMALFAILETLATRQWSANGPFVNPNHLAAYLNLLWPVALAAGAHETLQAERDHRRSHLGFLLTFMGGLMLCGVAMSQSRSGLIVATLLFPVWIVFELVTPLLTRHPFRWVHLGILLIPAALAVGAMAVHGGGLFMIQLETLADPMSAFENSGRTLAQESTSRMWSERPWFGMGAGTFAVAFPIFKDPELSGFWRYAHNDWLQYGAELGRVGGLFLLVLVTSAVGFRTLGSSFNVKRLCRRPLFRGTLLSLAGLTLHAAVDFPLHIPAVAFLAVWLVGVWPALAGGSSPTGKSPPLPSGS